jgi:hypothetical protein
LASIDIFEEDIIATRYLDKGKTVGRRLIDVDELMTMLVGLNKGIKWLEFSNGVVAVGRDGNGNSRILYVRPAKLTPMVFQTESRKVKRKISMPRLLAELTQDPSGSWVKLNKVFAFTGTLTDATILFVPPLPNMMNNGSVCMGQVNIRKIKAAAAAGVFEEAFIESVSTDHMTSAALVDGSKYRNILHAIKETNGKVPMQSLRKVGTYGEIYHR